MPISIMFRLVGRGEELADVIEHTGVGGRVRPRRAADRRLVDRDDLVEVVDALDALVQTGRDLRAVDALHQRALQDLVDEGRLARPRDAGDAHELAEREVDADVLEVVLLGADHPQGVAVAQAPHTRHRDRLLARQVLAGERLLVLQQLLVGAGVHDVAAVLPRPRPDVDDVVGDLHRVLVVLDDEDRVAEIAHADEGLDQALVHDINPATSDTEEIGYEVLGTAPNRVLVVAYFEVPMFSGACTDLLATQMAVLYETTNIVDVYILNKPTCETWNDGNAVLGIQNNAGTEAFVPPGRNTSDSPWTTEFEAWRFIPDGPSVTTITWLDESGAVVGDTADITVCPTGTQTYTARVDYLNCNGEIVSVEDTVTVTSNATFSFNLGDDIGTCDTDPITLDASTGVAGVTYQWFLDGAPIIGATDPTYDATTSGTYRCEATDGSCSVSDTIEVTFFSTPVANTPTDLTVCDDDNDGFAEFTLTDADAEIIAGQPDTFVNYYLTEAEADAGDTSVALASPYTNVSNPQTIWARIENSGGCFDTVSFTLTVLDSPVLNDPIPAFEICDDATADGLAIFDLTFWIPQISSDATLNYSFYSHPHGLRI